MATVPPRDTARADKAAMSMLLAGAAMILCAVVLAFTVGLAAKSGQRSDLDRATGAVAGEPSGDSIEGTADKVVALRERIKSLSDELDGLRAELADARSYATEYRRRAESAQRELSESADEASDALRQSLQEAQLRQEAQTELRRANDTIAEHERHTAHLEQQLAEARAALEQLQPADPVVGTDDEDSDAERHDRDSAGDNGELPPLEGISTAEWEDRRSAVMNDATLTSIEKFSALERLAEGVRVIRSGRINDIREQLTLSESLQGVTIHVVELHTTNYVATFHISREEAPVVRRWARWDKLSWLARPIASRSLGVRMFPLVNGISDLRHSPSTGPKYEEFQIAPGSFDYWNERLSNALSRGRWRFALSLIEARQDSRWIVQAQVRSKRDAQTTLEIDEAEVHARRILGPTFSTGYIDPHLVEELQIGTAVYLWLRISSAPTTEEQVARIQPGSTRGIRFEAGYWRPRY